MIIVVMTLMLTQQDFFAAIAAGDATKVQEMLERDPSLALVRDKNGVSALLTAVFRSRKSIEEVILSRNIELDIFEAASVGRTDRVRELAQRDSTLVNAYAPYGFFPLGLAAFFGHIDTVRALITAAADVNLQSRESMKVSALHSATAAGRLDIAQLLLANGANPNLNADQDFR